MPLSTPIGGLTARQLGLSISCPVRVSSPARLPIFDTISRICSRFVAKCSWIPIGYIFDTDLMQELLKMVRVRCRCGRVSTTSGTTVTTEC